MKKTIAAILMAGIFSLPAIAQHQERTPEQKARVMTEKMAENLELTSDQKESVYQANLEMANSMKESRASAHTAHQAKMKEILSDEQYAKMEQLQKERRKEAKHQRMNSSKHRDIKETEDASQFEER